MANSLDASTGHGTARHGVAGTAIGSAWRGAARSVRRGAARHDRFGVARRERLGVAPIPAASPASNRHEPLPTRRFVLYQRTPVFERLSCDVARVDFDPVDLDRTTILVASANPSGHGAYTPAGLGGRVSARSRTSRP
jgi:hypothetical protein